VGPFRLGFPLISRMPLAHLLCSGHEILERWAATGDDPIRVIRLLMIGYRLQFERRRIFQPSGRFSVALHIEVALHVADGKNETNLPAGGATCDYGR
jgi:hypothetical protein